MFSKCKTIKHGAVKGPKTYPQREIRRLKANNWDIFYIAIYRTCILFFIFIIIFLFLFLKFLLFPFGFLCFVCCFDFIVWLVFFVLPIILHFNLSSFTSLIFQITCYSWSCTFYSFYLDYIFLITLLLFQIQQNTLPWS